VLRHTRSIIQARFLPRETIGDVSAFVDSCLRSDLQQSQQQSSSSSGSSSSSSFALYVSPPKRVLAASCVLSDEGLVPAALLYLSWLVQPQPLSQPPAAAAAAEADTAGVATAAAADRPGSCLRADLLQAAEATADSKGGSSDSSGSSSAAAAAFPSGMAVVEPVSDKSSSSASADSKGGSSSGSSKGKGKPKWFKL
jgi:hypothetical protein